MKLVIDISEERYKDIRDYIVDKDCCHALDSYDLREIIRNGTPIEEKQTDGDLISRDYVLSKFKEQCDRCGKYKENNGVMCSCCALDDAIDYVEEAPSAEKTAEWIESDVEESVLAKCSHCGYDCGAYILKFCPNCGRRMKEEEK